jgi:hypothetical protein
MDRSQEVPECKIVPPVPPCLRGLEQYCKKGFIPETRSCVPIPGTQKLTRLEETLVQQALNKHVQSQKEN